MAHLVVRGLSPGIVQWLRARAWREAVSPEEVVRRILHDEYTERRRPPDGTPAAIVEAPPATEAKGLGTLIQEAVGPKGLVVEIPPRSEAGGREPIDFSGPEYGADDDDPPDPGETPGPDESRATTPKAAKTDTPPR